MSCDAVNYRTYFPSTPTSKEEADFPIAVVRSVYQDYYLLELMLSASYQPQNFYCFAMDNSSAPEFKRNLRQLADCFDNVHVPLVEQPLDGGGHWQYAAHRDCLAWLNDKEKRWRYVTILQNHDFPMKTNLEMVRVFKIFNESNDVLVTPEPGRINKKLNWTIGNLELFLDKEKQARLASTTISWAKGVNEMSISRAAMDYMMNEMNLTKLISMIDDGKTYGVDEIMYNTLLSMETLQIPGHFTQKCIKEPPNFVTRHSAWSWDPDCRSKIFRHALCMFGVEDLVPNLNNHKFQLYANKFMPDVDFNSIVCWLETLHNRTHIWKETKLDTIFYQNQAFVRYQNLKNEHGEVPTEVLRHFKCNV
ncbi:unnamed protein product [Bursaphelenchus okinawaensis]|uniref:Uncharacterized protein n=1 Tax=Bursaphelenchus okinawaensis TaxID=465554 RepID=A0A811KNS9_9BILA|nr:unnamed protein product [Bursaphelenchus okinawaensis]CAG9106506.1 unnamed protein product [Bursaphelenchus okinawaensis]